MLLMVLLFLFLCFGIGFLLNFVVIYYYLLVVILFGMMVRYLYCGVVVV